MPDTVADTKNPFNKDAKYEARLRTWQVSMKRQNDGYKRIEDSVQVAKNKRAHLQDEERTLTDKLGARARSIKAELIMIEKYIRYEQRGLNRRTAAREATMDEIARLAEKQIKSAEKAAKKWALAKREGRHVEPYIPSERAKYVRILVPLMGIVLNFFHV